MTVEEFLNALPEVQGRVGDSELSGASPVVKGQLSVLVDHSDFNDSLKLYGGMSLKSKLINIEVRLTWDGISTPPDSTAIWNFMPKIEGIHHAVNEDRSGKKIIEISMEVEGQPKYDTATKDFVAVSRLRVLAGTV